jgi:hypothetical protein
VEFEENEKDNIGNFYSDFIEICFKADDQYIEYYIKKEYKSIQGIIALSEGDKDTTQEYIIKIYSDENIVYTSDVIKAGVVPIEFVADISGAEKLRIVGELASEHTNWTKIYIAECILYP